MAAVGTRKGETASGRVRSSGRAVERSALPAQSTFLSNSLNAVSTLVLDGNGPAATRMLAQIGEFLRTILDREAVLETPLSQEIAFTHQYLAIEQTRLGGRLRIEVAIAPETLDALVPSMLLQPLVENAVRHGVAPLVEGGTIRLESKLHDGHCRSASRTPQLPALGPIPRIKRPTVSGSPIRRNVSKLSTPRIISLCCSTQRPVARLLWNYLSANRRRSER